jgi:polysaccharide export outer membrane protein
MRISADLPCRGIVAALTLSLAIGACADGNTAVRGTLTGEGPAQLGRTYRLGIGDKLKITVFGEENLSGSYEVNALGQVSLPLIGELRAAGSGINDFREQVARRLAEGYLKNPKVTVEVLNYRPIYVHGEVRSGGEFPYKNGIKFRDAIAVAGGYTYRANQNYLIVVREGQQEVKVPLPTDLPVLPGDNIRVPERFF